VEHAVIAHIRLTEGKFGSETERAALALLAEDLERVIDERQAGEFDGEEFGDGGCVLYMYGPDADRLFEVVEPVLRAMPMAQGGFVIKRYGSASDKKALEARVSI
jgi:hypothetical protein